MFHKIFSTKSVNFFKKRSNSIKDVSLNGKILFCPYTFDVYLRVPSLMGQILNLFISFRVFTAGEKILSSLAVLNVKNLLQKITKDKYHVS